MKSWVLLAGAFLIVGSRVPVGAQVPTQFDAATIKLDQMGPGNRGMKGGPGTNDPGRVTWQKVWLLTLVATAFHVDPRNISGPAWISPPGAQLYTFTATMPNDTSRHDFESMLQNFLIQQFRMKLHHELKAFPAYELVVAPDGAKLKASADPNDPDAPDILFSQPKIGSDGFAVLPPGHGALGIVNGGFHGTFQQYTMSEFADYLINKVTRDGDPTHYVVDKTGLTGRYDFKLKFDERADAMVVGPDVQAVLAARDGLEPGSGLPNIFKALEQQLGLRLIKAKDIPVDTIVIDQAERIPVGN
jgi:uncharacterized protein (TIGR03435 family)